MVDFTKINIYYNLFYYSIFEKKRKIAEMKKVIFAELALK